MQSILASFLTVLIMVFSSTANAEKTTIIADADIMEKNSRTQTLSLKGNVNVIFHQQHLLCDEAIVYEDKSLIIATGNVVMQNAKTTLRGDKVEFNYNTNKGKIFNGVITSGQVLIQADIIEKIGPDEYVADDAYYTACLTCPPSWGFTSSQITAEIGSYAYINRPWLYLLEFPVLPLPYLVVPLNSKRQTGFLVPKPSNNANGGLALEIPFFWAIDRSHDATFSLINYEKRGPQMVSNYRYVISPTSSGELSGSFLNDRAKGSKNRWFLQYEHLYDLPNNYTQRTEIALTSDRLFAQDFEEQFRYNGYPALENTISLSKSFENSLLSLEASYYISLLENSEQLNFENPDGVHRMPEINYNIADQKISEDYNLFFSLDLQYLNITSQGVAFRNARSGYIDPTDPATTGECPGSLVDSDVCFLDESPTGEFIYGTPNGQPASSNQTYGDLIRTGQRLDIMPTIHAPFWVGSYLDVDPSLSLRYTQYSLGVKSDPNQNFDSFPSRFYTQLGLSGKSYLSKVFDWNNKTKIKHSIIPEINIRYIPKVHQTKHNFFGAQENLKYIREIQPIDDTDAHWRDRGRGIQFDNRDRVIGKQIVDFAITNKILSRQTNSDNIFDSQYQQNLLLKVSQTFDINEARMGNNSRPWQDIRTELLFNTGPFSQILGTSYYPYHARTNWNSISRYRFYGANFIEIMYSKYYTIPIDPPVDENTRREVVSFGTGLTFDYLKLYGNVEYDLKTTDPDKKFKRWAAIISLRPPGSCWSLNGDISQRLDAKAKDINYGFSMEFEFGG